MNKKFTLKNLLKVTKTTLLTKSKVLLSFLLILFSSFAFNNKAMAQVPNLALGDVAITSYYSDGGDRFSFVNLVPITANTEIFFSDQAWNGSALFTSSTSEGVIRWFTATAIPLGTQVTITGLTASQGTATAVINSASGLNLSTAGDQIFAYQGPNTSPTFLTGLHYNFYIGPPATADADWDGASYNSTSITSSRKPPTLTTGTNAMRAGVEFDNGKLNCAGLPKTTKALALAYINDDANWVFDNDGLPTSATAGAFPSCPTYIGTPPPAILVTSFTGTTPSASNTVTFNLILDMPIASLTPANFTTTVTGGMQSALVTNVAGSGTSWTVTVTAVGGSTGTVTCNFTNASVFVGNLPYASNAITINPVVAAPNLALGDIAITSYYSDNGDRFSFVNLVPLTANTEIFFSDKQWTGTALVGTVGSASDGIIKWLTTTAIPVGTQITISGITASQGTITSINNTAAGINLSTAGDQIFAFQGPSTSPTFLAGLHYNFLAGPPATDDANWDDGTLFTATSNTGSGRPPTLTTGTYAMRAGVEFDNGKLNCSGLPVATKALALAYINDDANWVFDNDGTSSTGGTYPSCALYFGTPPTPITVTSFTGTTPTASNTLTFNLTLDMPIASLTPANFTTTLSGGMQSALVTNVSGSGTSWTVTVTAVGGSTGTVTCNFTNAAVLFSNLPYASNAITINPTIAAPNLALGDIAITSYFSDGGDRFSFVNLVPLAANTEIFFSDKQWTGTALGGTSTNDGIIKWVTTSAISVGTQITITGITASQGTITSIDNTAAGLNFSTGGDQIFAFQGPSATPTFLAGLHYNFLAGPPATDDANWDDGTLFASTSSTGSGRPPALLTGTYAMRAGVEFDNGKLDCSGLPKATKALALAYINDDANWVFDNDELTIGSAFPACASFLTSPCYTLTSAVATTNQSVCVGAPFTDVTFTVDPSVMLGGFSPNLPAGLVASVTGSVLTISGTPTAAQASTSYNLVVVSPAVPSCFPSNPFAFSLAVNAAVQIDSLVATPAALCEGDSASIQAFPGLVAAPYCASAATSFFDSKIDTVSFAGVTVGTSPTAGEVYTDNTATIIPAAAGVALPLSIRNGSSGTHFAGRVKVFIDYDQSGVFDASEMVYEFGQTTAINTIPPTTVTIPTSAYNGTTRMRIVFREGGTTTSTQACGTYTFGDTEDYTINISGGTTNPTLGFASIAWTPSATLNIANGDSVVAQGLTATTLFTAIGTDANGCMDTATVNVTVTPAPVVTVSAATNPICPGDSSVLTAAGADTYAWSPVALTGAMPTVAPTATTTYTVTGTETATGCSADASVTVNLITPLALDSITASPDTVCAGGTSMLAASAREISTFDLYSFASATGTTLDPMTSSTTAVGSNEDDTYTSGHTIGFNFDYNGTSYTTFGTSSNGFMVLGGAGGNSDLSNGFGTTMLAVNLPMIAPWWDDCHTQNDSITYTTIGTAPNRTLIVDFGLAIRYLSATANTQSQVWLHETTNEIELVYGPSTALNSPSGSVGLAGTTTTAEMQSVNTATNTSSTTTASNALTVFPANGTKYTFTPPAATTITYAWTPTADAVNPTMAMTTTNPLLATTNFIVSATDGTTGCVSTDSVEVVVEGPTLALSATPGAAVCPGDPVTIQSGAVGATDYSWNGATGSSMDTTLTPAVAGTYTITATDAVSGCSLTDSITISTINPIISSLTASDTTVCTGGSVTLAVLPGLAGVSTPFCVATYSNGTGGGDFIDSVGGFGGLLQNQTGAGAAPYYQLFPTPIAVTTATPYTVTVRNGTFQNQEQSIWIDYNHDSIFQATEQVGQFNSIAANALTTFTVNIPTSAYNGTTLMRVMDDFFGSSPMDPCQAALFGETEDYILNISGGATNEPTPFDSIAWTPSTYLDTTTQATVNAVNMLASTTYTVTGYFDAGCSVSDSITINVDPAPMGNIFTNPIVVSSLPYVDSNDNLSANCWSDQGVHTGNRSGNDVFYEFAMPGCTDSIVATLCNTATNWDTYMHLLDSTGATVTSDDDDCGVRSTINWGGLVKGATYYIVVDGFNASQEDSFIVNIDAYEPAVAASLAQATSNQTLMQGDGATFNYYNPSCELIANVNDGMGANVLGTTVSTVTVDATAGFHNGQPYARRWYQITPTSNGPADVTLYFNQTDFDDLNTATVAPYLQVPTSGSNTSPNIANIRITKNDDAGLGTNPIVLTPSTVNWNGTYWEVTVTAPGFSQFRLHTVNPNNTALPVRYTNFTVRKESTVDVVEWTTANEQNNKHFNVQRSANGNDFITLGTVETKAPNGNSAGELNYSFVDQKPMTGHNYYRLEQVDIDNKTNMSEVIDIVWGTNGSVVSIYPNPASTNLNIDLTTSQIAQTEIKLLDMSGRVVKSVLVQTQKGLNHIAMELDDLASGVYGIQVVENNKLTHISKISKN